MTIRILAFVLIAGVTLSAQSPVVDYDAPGGTTIAQNQSWTPVLIVNGQPFVGAKPSCVGTTAIVCTFPLPDISSALTASGPQTFRIVLRDPVLGDGPAGAPLSLIRPGAGVNLRFRGPGQ